MSVACQLRVSCVSVAHVSRSVRSCFYIQIRQRLFAGQNWFTGKSRILLARKAGSRKEIVQAATEFDGPCLLRVPKGLMQKASFCSFSPFPLIFLHVSFILDHFHLIPSSFFTFFPYVFFSPPPPPSPPLPPPLPLPVSFRISSSSQFTSLTTSAWV